MDIDPRLAHVRQKLVAGLKLNDNDHASVLRSYLDAHPDPLVVNEVRQNLRNPVYLRRMRDILNQQRRQNGLPVLTKLEFDRLVYLMEISVQ